MNKSMKKTGATTRLVLIISIAVLTASIAYNNISGGGAPGKGGAPSAGGRPGAEKGGSSAEVETVFSVKAEKPLRTDIKEFIKLNGDISTENSVDIYPETSGKLHKRFVSIGDYVFKGDIIAEVDPSKPGTVYEPSPVEATITGTVTSLPGSIGDTVSTGTSIATIGDLSKLQIEVFIPEKEITWIETGLSGTAELAPYPEDFIPVTITEVSPVLDPDSRTLEVKLSADSESENRMKAGMFASVLIYTRTAENAVSVPFDSVLSNDKGDFVYIVEGDKSSVKYVETGLKSDTRIEIKSGLDIDDLVVVQGQYLVNNGASVKIIEGEK